MLDLQADLEADLGIDSIKRVEIVAAFRREVLRSRPEPAAGFMERLMGARTLGAIVENIAGAASAGAIPAERAGGPGTPCPPPPPPAAARGGAGP
jgi:acyl carrier protein